MNTKRPLIDYFGLVVLMAGGIICQNSIADESSPTLQKHDQQSRDQQSRDQRLKWWRQARFGMFVHWGVYSTVGGEYKGQKLPNSAEWMMARGKIAISEYENYAKQFNPTKFDAAEFVGLAKEAGMKYIVITAKHHDGFSMFGSKCSDYNVVDATPFNRDIMKELSVECQKQGLKLGFYYSQAQDWHHPGGMGNSWDKTIKRVSNDEYVMKKAVPEVRQLLTEYGPIGIFWWDTPRKMSEESFDALHTLTKLQPNVITNDRLGEGYRGDYKTFERKIPPHAPPGEDWEVCMPISGSWGYKKGDDAFKSTTKLVRNLIDIASKGGNYLLNVSPTGEGTLLPPAVERLKAVGKWMEVNGDSIYGTSASPLPKLTWGRCTAKSNGSSTTLYLHIFDWPSDGKILVPGIKNNIQVARLIADQSTLTTKATDDGVVLSLPNQAPDEYATVIEMEIEGMLEVVSQIATPDNSGTLVLNADDAYVHNNEGSKQAEVRSNNDVPNIGYWTDDKAWVEWSIKIDVPGRYEVSAILSVAGEKTAFSIGTEETLQKIEITGTGGYGNYQSRSLGTIQIDQAGPCSIRLKPQPGQWQPINLRSVKLKRSPSS